MVAVESTMLPLATKAPDFTLPDPSGRKWSLPDVAGRHGTLVIFACNHCPYVRHIAPALAEATARWIADGIGVIAVNSNDADRYPADRPEAMASQASEWRWTFPYVFDGDQKVAHAYKAACTPDFYLFDADLQLVYRGRFDGSTPGNGVEITGAELDAAVQALIAGAAQPDDQIPSVGCNIKWRPGNEPPWFG